MATALKVQFSNFHSLQPTVPSPLLMQQDFASGGNMDDHSDTEGEDVEVTLIENDVAQEDVKAESVSTAMPSPKSSGMFHKAPDRDTGHGRAGANALDDDLGDVDRKPANPANKSHTKVESANPGAGGASDVEREPAAAEPATAGSSFIHVIRLPKPNVPYAQWTQHHLRLACKHRGVPNMSRSKDNTEMARRLEGVDRHQRRPSPYVGDFRQAGTSSSCRGVTWTTRSCAGGRRFFSTSSLSKFPTKLMSVCKHRIALAAYLTRDAGPTCTSHPPKSIMACTHSVAVKVV